MFLIVAVLIAGIASTGQTPKWVIGMSQCNRGEPWRVQMDADIKKAARNIQS